MINRCPSCGGFLRYDIASGKLKCESCASELLPEEYHDEQEAEEIQQGVMETTIFTCPACGGEVTAGTLDAVGYCSFCGGEVTLESRMEKIRRPDRIVPFTVTEEECREAYRKALKKAPFVPGSLKKDRYLEKFRSIYVPYWSYEVEYGPHATLDSYEETRKGNYIYKKHWTLDVDYEAKVANQLYDASSALDDNISGEMTSAALQGETRPFSSSYLFGVYTDTADLDSSLYRQDARWDANNELEERMSRDKELLWDKKLALPEKGRSRAYGMQDMKEPELLLLPVWFLTWRKKDKVAYSLVNGKTGEVAAELPQSFLRFLLGSLLISVPVFFILNLGLTLMPSVILAVAAVLSAAILDQYEGQLKQIHARINHLDDKGYLAAKKQSYAEADTRKHKQYVLGGPKKQWEKRKERASSISEYLVFLSVILIVCLIMDMSEVYTFLENRIVLAIVFVICDGLAVLFLSDILSRKYQGCVPLAGRLLDVSGVVFSIVLAQVIVFINPPEDWIYWCAVVLSLLGVTLAISGMVREFNLLVTRPVPHFFDRGGDKT